MITPKIKALFQFIDFLHSNIDNFKQHDEVIKNLDSLTEETQRLETIYRQKLIALNELKQSILQKAFTGQLTK